VPSTARDHRDAARADRVLGPLDVHQDLPLERASKTSSWASVA
jgi:hypothetical protein